MIFKKIRLRRFFKYNACVTCLGRRWRWKSSKLMKEWINQERKNKPGSRVTVRQCSTDMRKSGCIASSIYVAENQSMANCTVYHNRIKNYDYFIINFFIITFSSLYLLFFKKILIYFIYYFYILIKYLLLIF